MADRLAARGWTVVLTGSPEERGVAAEVMEHMAAPALVVSRAALVVSNDTAMSHIAAAGGTPSVIVSSGADPVRWAPLDQARHRVLFASVACRPCAYEACPIGHPCALDVRAERVLEAALDFCEGGAFHAPSVMP